MNTYVSVHEVTDSDPRVAANEIRSRHSVSSSSDMSADLATSTSVNLSEYRVDVNEKASSSRRSTLLLGCDIGCSYLR